MSFFRNTVDDVIKDFNKVVVKLSVVAESYLTEAETRATKAAQELELSKVAKLEAERAASIAAKLRTLLS